MENKMGLDMYAFAIQRSVAKPVDFKFGPVKDLEEIHYWRKHPNLHGWMEALYFAKGGSCECFNVAFVQLDLADLKRLEADVVANRLPETEGFFFGESDGSEREDDLAFIGKAREAIRQGKVVFYTSWW
jgi:hypothetical protein